MKEKYLKLFQQLLETKIQDSHDLEVWKGKAINLVRRIYGSESAPEKQIVAIKYTDYFSARGSGGSNISGCIKQAYGFANSIINELETLGLPELKQSNSGEKINITVNQSQSQDQTVKLKVILNALQDELTGKQLKELQDILDAEADQEEKRSKLIEKIKTFGSDVLSNIIANLLTNPIFG